MKKIFFTLILLLYIALGKNVFCQLSDTTFSIAENTGKSLYVYVPEVSEDSVRYIGTVKAYDKQNDPLTFSVLPKPPIGPFPNPTPNPTPWPTATKNIFLIHYKLGDLYVEKKNCKYLFSIKKHQFVVGVTDGDPQYPIQTAIITVVTKETISGID